MISVRSRYGYFLGILASSLGPYKRKLLVRENGVFHRTPPPPTTPPPGAAADQSRPISTNPDQSQPIPIPTNTDCRDWSAAPMGRRAICRLLNLAIIWRSSLRTVRLVNPPFSQEGQLHGSLFLDGYTKWYEK